MKFDLNCLKIAAQLKIQEGENKNEGEREIISSGDQEAVQVCGGVSALPPQELCYTGPLSLYPQLD